MIRLLKGILEASGDDWLIINVHGVGYEVFTHTRTLSQLPIIGKELTLHIITHVREDHIHLFGFTSLLERQWFEILQKVQGVGAKMAMTILSSLSPDDISNAILADDKKTLCQAQGVGAKLAGRIISELQDNIAKNAPMIGNNSLKTMTSSDVKKDTYHLVQQEALSALEGLGYSRQEAFTIIRDILAQDHDTLTSEKLIELALQQLGKQLNR